MSKNYINPSFNITSNDLNNIFGLLAKQIGINIKHITSLTIETEYNDLINNIYNLTKNIIVYYNFFFINNPPSRFNLNISIYNQNIKLIAELNFIINQFYYIYSSSTWNQFINNKIPNIRLVYDNLSPIEQNNLNYTIIKNCFYYVDNIIFTIDAFNATGLLLKLDNCKCDNELINNYCLMKTQIYIISIFWY